MLWQRIYRMYMTKPTTILSAAQISAGADISRLIKMLTSDNVKDMARKLGKSSHAHPLLFAEKVLNQLER